MPGFSVNGATLVQQPFLKGIQPSSVISNGTARAVASPKLTSLSNIQNKASLLANGTSGTSFPSSDIASRFLSHLSASLGKDTRSASCSSLPSAVLCKERSLSTSRDSGFYDASIDQLDSQASIQRCLSCINQLDDSLMRIADQFCTPNNVLDTDQDLWDERDFPSFEAKHKQQVDGNQEVKKKIDAVEDSVRHLGGTRPQPSPTQKARSSSANLNAARMRATGNIDETSPAMKNGKFIEGHTKNLIAHFEQIAKTHRDGQEKLDVYRLSPRPRRAIEPVQIVARWYLGPIEKTAVRWHFARTPETKAPPRVIVSDDTTSRKPAVSPVRDDSTRVSGQANHATEMSATSPASTQRWGGSPLWG